MATPTATPAAATPPPQNLGTPPTGFYSPLGGFSQKDQAPTGSPYNPLHWPQWFSYHKNRLGLPNPGKFERLHGEVKGNISTHITRNRVKKKKKEQEGNNNKKKRTKRKRKQPVWLFCGKIKIK